MTTHVSVKTKPLPPVAHTGRPWRIHEIAPDFELEDVWALPTPGGPGDLPLLATEITRDEERDFPIGYRVLFAIRWWLGGLLGLDDEDDGFGGRVASLRERLPDDLLDRPGPEFDDHMTNTLYLTEREFAVEIANATAHAIMHIGWVKDPSAPGGYRGQMAVLVRPNGLLGHAYMTFIKPFRYLVVYPAMLRTLARRWETATGVAA